MRKPSRPVHLSSCLLAWLSIPAEVWAQSPGIQAPPTTPVPTAQGGAVGIVVAVVALCLAIGIAVKLYDLRRKRDEGAVFLQARISNAVQLDSSLATLPVSVFARAPLWRRSPAVVEIIGTVPTPELRDAVVRLVRRELSQCRPDARTEDRVVVDPLMAKHVA